LRIDKQRSPRVGDVGASGVIKALVEKNSVEVKRKTLFVDYEVEFNVVRLLLKFKDLSQNLKKCRVPKIE
jgi:hypothetical protein